MFILHKYMIICLTLTIIIEGIVAFFIKVRDKKDFVNIILVNCMTNPLVVTIPIYLNISYGYTYGMISYLLLEIFAVISEGYIYKKYLNYNKINPFIFSFILNFISFALGEIIGRI